MCLTKVPVISDTAGLPAFTPILFVNLPELYVLCSLFVCAPPPPHTRLRYVPIDIIAKRFQQRFS